MRLVWISLLLVQQFLLRQPIQTAFQTGDMSALEAVCQERVSVAFEAPFTLSGYYQREKFIRLFSRHMSNYGVRNLEWLTRQVEERFAIQSLNLILIDNRTETLLYYKFIFFLTKQDAWTLYHIKGLRL